MSRGETRHFVLIILHGFQTLTERDGPRGPDPQLDQVLFPFLVRLFVRSGTIRSIDVESRVALEHGGKVGKGAHLKAH